MTFRNGSKLLADHMYSPCLCYVSLFFANRKVSSERLNNGPKDAQQVDVRAIIPIPVSLALCLNLAFRKARLRPRIPGLDPSGGLSCWASAEPHAKNTDGGCSFLTRDNPR